LAKKKSKSSFLLLAELPIKKPIVLATIVLASTIGVYLVYKTYASGGIPAIVTKAAAQLGVVEQPNGCNCGPQVNVYTDNHHEPWCADFVSWVYKMTGHPFTGGQSGGWRIAYVPYLEDWFQARNFWHVKTSSDTPQPGDVVTFNWDGGVSDHTGIVDHVSGTTLYTIEGNTSNGVYRRSYASYHSNANVVGWGRIPAPAPTPAPTVASVCPTHPLLESGSKGVCVSYAQGLLNKKISAGLAVDGDFGPLTDAATRRFQKLKGLVVDGQIGPKTWNALEQ
jgi:hypothetical protein